MNPNVTKMFKRIKDTTSKHSPEILTGIGVAGMIATVVLSVKATPKALQKIEDAEVEKNDKLTKVEVVKVAWKPYIPAAVSGVVSTACLIGANSVNVRRNAALMTAYQISTTALNEYKESVREAVDEEKLNEIKQKVAKKKVEEVATKEERKPTVIISDEGDTRFIDPISNTPFPSSKNKIDAAVNQLNKRMLSEMYVSLSDLYDELGIERTSISDHMGWNIDRGFIETDLSDAIVQNGKAYVVLDFLVRPDYNFDKLI